ncbi:MAG: DUF1501 domain-containing protein [Verrucomicrobia bacterium]|nr:DUF1501 domain-containing protein [Verrucomicrobiota bacterium]
MHHESCKRSITPREGVTRRDFLQTSTLGAIGLGMSKFAPLETIGAVNKQSCDKACIMIFNVGAPSQLDTFDMKPDAPREIRGPFKPIRTNNPDIQISEILPLHAKLANKFSLVRSCYHSAPAIHDSGHQLMQTGRLSAAGVNTPHAGCVAEFFFGGRNQLPAHVILPEPMRQTGGNLSHGQDAGFLGRAYDPFVLNSNASRKTSEMEASDLTKEPMKIRERYGMNRFGQSCLLARRLVERGVRFVTLNTFTTVFNEATWDIHGFKPFTTITAMKEIVAPMYDQGYSALIEDLFQRGMLDTTLVAALAEFGRTPAINAAGGRDHWTQCWTTYFAGGGIKGGRVVGKSDSIGAYPMERPVAPGEIVATIYHSLGLNFDTQLSGPDSRSFPLVDSGAQPIWELF